MKKIHCDICDEVVEINCAPSEEVVIQVDNKPYKIKVEFGIREINGHRDTENLFKMELIRFTLCVKCWTKVLQEFYTKTTREA